MASDKSKMASDKSKMASETSSSLAHKYQKKTDKQHVLDTPDTYTGTMETTECDTYVYDETTNKIVPSKIDIIPGLYKLFDEAVVNARDHQVRMAQAISSGKPDSLPVTYIDISISDDGVITLTNDGNGIDVEKHPEHDIWIPEMIFGHLRTSTNYDKTEKKTVGGKNGFGFKLVLIWSTWGKIETIDHVRGLKYVQEFENNLDVIKKPSIRKCKNKPYTSVSFKPDYARLGLTGLSKNMMELFRRRVYDIAAVTDKKVRVKYNGEVVPVKHFQHYVDMFIGKSAEGGGPRAYETTHDRWEYAVCLAPSDEFTQVSFVNGIFTGKGGKHVDYILGQIVRKLTAYIKKKKKIDVKPTTIKEQLMLFVRCDVDNPSFDSQTKDCMNTPSNKFGSSCNVSDKFIEQIAKMGVMNAACALTEVKQHCAAKKTDGTKSKSIRGIPKLIDANFAGTKKSELCTIILCEGDSAKAGIVSGLSKEDRNVIGVYPMRGKLLNVRGEQIKRIMENKEIAEIKQILGLETGKKYDAESARTTLRYSKVLFMTDQDLDGSHIKGLGINLFDAQWQSLLDIPGFMGFMNTPILKARKGAQEKLFYNDGEYEEWKEENDMKGWKIKYYKGLGTSTSKEFKEYFQHKKSVEFVSTGVGSREAIDSVFNKKRANDRKEWLGGYNRDLYLDTNQENVTYEEFIAKEMIHFSKYDCDRSIPNLVDGLKTSQRKILYTAFKRKLTHEIKVAQFSGSVSEISCYHHGEASLNGAIVAMAQDFVGSSNINLLMPKGQFGTRLQGGNDSASERYIFTQLHPLARAIFPEADDAVLKFLDDDGTPVEPMYYVPLIPMILANGSKGIGTGFSSEVMAHDPLHIIDYISAKLCGDKHADKLRIMPYYHGFKGTITPISDDKFMIKGKYEIISDKQIRITELPVGTWTDNYKQFIEGLIDAGTQKSSTKDKPKTSQRKHASTVRDYVDMSTDVTVDITVTFSPGMVKKLHAEQIENGCNALEKLLKLFTTRSTNNMHVFDECEKLKKFNTAEEIADYYIRIRHGVYVVRKAAQLKALREKAKIQSNKARFISEVLEDTLDLRRKKKAEVNTILTESGYDMVDDDDDYKYLVRMPMDSVTEENVEKILQEKKDTLAAISLLEGKTEKQIWLEELAVLREEYVKHKRSEPVVKSTSPKKLKMKKK
jgi:DNA topoisomerase-2